MKEKHSDAQYPFLPMLERKQGRDITCKNAPWNHEIRKHKETVLAHPTEQLVTLQIYTIANKLMYHLHFEHFKHQNKQV